MLLLRMKNTCNQLSENKNLIPIKHRMLLKEMFSSNARKNLILSFSPIKKVFISGFRKLGFFKDESIPQNLILINYILTRRHIHNL